jgi:hypothetical protein
LKTHNNLDKIDIELKPHGSCLAASDIDRIKTFIAEFVARGFIPWLERTIKSLHDQVQSKRSILKSFGLQKKIFGGVNRLSSSTSSNIQQNFSSTNENNNENQQLRLIADLTFSFKLYESAHTYYTMWKKEFSIETSTINHASAFEMISLSSFLQNTNFNKYLTPNFVEEAVGLYKSLIINMPYFVIRFVLFITEILKASGHYIKAAYMFLNMSYEDDLISALFYEQASLCFIASQPPMIRKFAYYMAVAGFRYNENGKVRIA